MSEPKRIVVIAGHSGPEEFFIEGYPPEIGKDYVLECVEVGGKIGFKLKEANYAPATPTV